MGEGEELGNGRRRRKAKVSMERRLKSGDLLAAAEAAEMAANAETDQQEMAAVMEVMRHKEAIQIGLIQSRMQRCSQSPHAHERLPLREDGDDIGKVEARIPRELFFHLMQQKNFGWEGLTSDEGMRDLMKAHPVCRVKTVSGKTTVSAYVPKGGTSARRKRQGVVFGRGTMEFAR